MKKNIFSKTIYMWLFAALCCLLWGSAFPTIKKGYELLNIQSSDTFSIILFAGIRFFGAGVLTIAIFSVVEQKFLVPKKSSLKKIGVLSLFQTIIQYLFFYLGLAFTSGSRGALINATAVFFAILISALIFKMESLSMRKILGSVVGFVGVVLVSLDAFSSGGSLLGEVFILVSSVSYAFSSVFMKRYSESENPAMLSGYQFMLGGAVMIGVGLLFGGTINIANVGSIILLLYLMMVSAVAYSLWSILLKYNPVSKVMVCDFMTPIFGFFLSSLFEKTPVGLYGIASLILVVLGIITVNSDDLHK